VVQLQENALKFYGMAIDTPINIPQSQFEVSPTAITERLHIQPQRILVD
jgi:hypothetical protein